MAKKSATTKQKSFEESLWDSANKLRGSVEPSEYKHVVLSLIFLKFVSDTFEARKQEIIAEHGDQYINMVDFYTMKNAFYLPEESRWSYIKKNAKQDDISVKIDTALHDIEKKNKTLAGALPDNYFSRLDLEVSKLAALLDEINNIQTISNQHEDVVGRVYEYFLGKFALAEGKSKGGEYYTPKSIVNLIAEMIEPYKGKIYDPCCGSGGMFVQSMKFVDSHKGNRKDISIYGQELTTTTYKLAKMNLAIRGIAANFGAASRDTFAKDQHPDLKADFIMANPPFNLKNWRAINELVDDPRWNGYDTPPVSNANYGWILHMVSKLSENGVGGFVLANGALSSLGVEKDIRQKLIENDLIEAIVVLPMDMFYTTDISVSLWLINKNKSEKIVTKGDHDFHYRNRQYEILFIDARNYGSVFEKKYIEFDVETDISEIASIYHRWQQKNPSEPYHDNEELCYSARIEEIKEKNFSLVPSRYIRFKKDEKFTHLEKDISDLKESILNSVAQEAEINESILAILRHSEGQA
jgi:type I restriction enzyme M protein